MKLEFLTEARSEFLEAVDYYEEKQLGLGKQLLAEGEESAGATAGDYQRETAEKDREYDSTASALEGKRELNDDETARLRRLWKKLVRMFDPDLHGGSTRALACGFQRPR